MYERTYNRPVAGRTFRADRPGTCALCGCRYANGDTVIWSRSRDGRSTVTHEAGQCGGSYVVKVVYACTSKLLKYAAYSASQALDLAAVATDPIARAIAHIRLAQESRLLAQDPDTLESASVAIVKAEAEYQAALSKARPDCYVCYQGNLIVETRTVTPAGRRAPGTGSSKRITAAINAANGRTA